MDEPVIDDLYRGPLAEFTAARQALARTLAGADAARVRKLPKPLLVPWAVNQVYWKARGVYHHVLASGKRLREAQIATMEGTRADVRAASEAHRRAVADAVKSAERLAAVPGSTPAPDALAQMFEAVSLAATLPEQHGRFTRPLQPAGFEALAGVKPRALPRQAAAGPVKEPAKPSRADRALQARATREARLRANALTKAETVLERARAAEAEAREVWERTKRDVETATKKVRDLQS